MQNKQRELYLKIGVGVVVGLFLFDRMILSPAINSWKEQSDRIAALRQKVVRGRQLIERQDSIQSRWAEMMRTDMPEEASAGESEVFQAVGRWTTDSKISFTNLTPQWHIHDGEGGYDTLDCRASATGDQASLGRLLYELETDPLPAKLHECEITARDAKGGQLMLTVHFSFVRISDSGKNGR
ncbi:MAG: hypothetical protein JWL59_722 [Chthoniobacteraceae bacterium]|nr:hypothetical protein [Chthoniobacteraceae bacterium]